jgi:DNA-binding PadR family transcriptional regulator
MGAPLTESMFYILLSLLQPNHGYGIMQQVEERTKGRVALGAGTLVWRAELRYWRKNGSCCTVRTISPAKRRNI